MAYFEYFSAIVVAEIVSVRSKTVCPNWQSYAAPSGYPSRLRTRFWWLSSCPRCKKKPVGSMGASRMILKNYMRKLNNFVFNSSTTWSMNTRYHLFLYSWEFSYVYRTMLGLGTGQNFWEIFVWKKKSSPGYPINFDPSLRRFCGNLMFLSRDYFWWKMDITVEDIVDH